MPIEDSFDGLPRNHSDDQLSGGPGDVYRYGQYRLETFSNWPQTAKVDKSELARNGFYYLGEEDRVKCVFCNVILRKWESGDVVSAEHKKHAPQCPLLTNPEIAGNFPYQTNNQQLNPKYPEYKSRELRLKSYTKWPSRVKQRPEQLACAGFFYLGVEDAVKCFCCGGILRSWDEKDVPWEEHKKWFPLCPFILANGPSCQQQINEEKKRKLISIAKNNGYSDDILNFHTRYGKEHEMPYPETYHDLVDELEQLRIQQTSDQTPQGATGYTHHIRPPHNVPPTIPENENPSKEESTTALPRTNKAKRHTIMTQWSVIEQFQCKICFDSPVEVIFLPCNHVCCCQKCSEKLTVHECPICRTKIKAVQAIYLA